MNDWITPGENLKEDLTFTIDPISLLTIDDFYCTIETEAKDKPEKNLLSKKFIDLIGQGYKPGEAAKRVGTSIKGLMSDSKVKKQIKDLLTNYKLEADVRREMSRAIANQIALENKDGDPMQQKLALDAIKVIGSDTEVGINAPPQPGIQINVGNLQGLFDSLEIPKHDEVINAEIIEEEKNEPFRLTTMGETESNNSPVLDFEAIERLTEQSKE